VKVNTYLNSRSVDVKLLEDCKGLLVKLVVDGNVGDIRGVIIVQSVDVFHDSGSVSLDSG